AVPGDALHMSDESRNLETSRLWLRPITADDLDDLARLFGDPLVMRYLGTGNVRSREESSAALNDMIDHWARRGYGIWALCERHSGRFLGRCGLQFLDALGETELLYTLLRECWGRGYATEAATAALRFGLEQCGLERVVALALPEHTASLRVLAKIGMRL